MSSKTEEAVRTGEIGVDDERIIEELIFSQAEDLVDGIRECVQNGVDAPGSTQVTVNVTPELTVIEDDGDGMDLTDEEIEQYLTNLGMSTKRDDDDSIGQFGIGFGQALAKGRVTVNSHDTIVKFDAKNKLREYDIFEADDSYDGFRVEIEHYDDEVPDPDSSEWDSYVDDLEDRFQFMELVHGVEVEINGEVVSDKDPVENTMYDEPDATYEDDKMVITLRMGHYGSIDVYSAGIRVDTKHSHGLQGVVITKENLDLNTARNSIKSGCSLWSEVADQIESMKVEIYEDREAENLVDKARADIPDLIANGHDQFTSFEVFKDANGEQRSLDWIQAHDEMSWAESGDRWGGKLANHGYAVMLSDDEACSALMSADIELPETVEGQQTAAALGLSMGYEEKSFEDIESDRTARRIAIARILAHKMGIDREIRFGEDEMANAWTDGDDYIVLTETVWTVGHWSGWVQQIYRVLCHEAAHDEDSSGEPSHGNRFARNFRDLADKRDNAFVELSKEISRGSIKTVIQDYEHVHDLIRFSK